MSTIYADVSASIEVKKSKFICYLHKTVDEEDAKDFIKAVKKEHPSARHHCPAIIVGNIVRSSDDGEPSGTAGRPILETLQKKGITQITAVVVRYFGGTLLGTGGLVRAYTDAVLAALEQATLCELTELDEYEIHFDYSLINAVDSYFAKHKITVTDKQYEDTAIYRFATAKDISSDLAEISSGKIKPHFLRKITIESRI
jgi:uncharacterized YigZ family protein